MTEPRTPPVDLQEFLDELAQEEELERLSTLSHEELLGEMKAEGIDPERGRAAARRALEGQARRSGGGEAPPTATERGLAGAKVVDLASARKKRGVPVARLVLAAAAAVALSVGLVKRGAIEAWLTPAPAPTEPPLVPPTHEETPQEKAEKLRQEAYVNVLLGYYGEATDQLDAAKALDPAGDEADRAQSARGEILANKHAPPGGNSKPPVGPGERPLSPPRPNRP